MSDVQGNLSSRDSREKLHNTAALESCDGGKADADLDVANTGFDRQEVKSNNA